MALVAHRLSRIKPSPTNVLTGKVAELKAALDVARLQEEAHRGSHAAPADALGWVIAVTDAPETLDKWLRALSDCERYAFVLAYTFDVGAVVEALIRARNRGADVRVLLDRNQALNDTTRNLIPAVIRLARHGVKVRLLLRRRQHAKALLTDKALVLGSTNWTDAAQHNVERGAALRLFGADHNTQQCLFLSLWETGKDWEAGTHDAALVRSASSASP